MYTDVPPGGIEGSVTGGTGVGIDSKFVRIATTVATITITATIVETQDFPVGSNLFTGLFPQ